MLPGQFEWPTEVQQLAFMYDALRKEVCLACRKEICSAHRSADGILGVPQIWREWQVPTVAVDRVFFSRRQAHIVAGASRSAGNIQSTVKTRTCTRYKDGTTVTTPWADDQEDEVPDTDEGVWSYLG